MSTGIRERLFTDDPVEVTQSSMRTTVSAQTVSQPQFTVSSWIDALEVTPGGDPVVPNVLLDWRAFQKERKLRAPGGKGHNLRDYWIRGKGAAKIRWGTEGSMKRCIRQLRKYVRDPGGLCATYHHIATGEWPRGGLIPSSGDAETLDVQAAGARETTHAGLVVLAQDTGRILMLQRGLSDDDPASGTWEFPGGGIEQNEEPLEAAMREWREEIGQDLPSGDVITDWTSLDGVYAGFVYAIPRESDVTLADGRVVVNPDDPDGDMSEQAAWWAIEDAARNPALRAECSAAHDGVPWIKMSHARALSSGVSANGSTAAFAGGMGPSEVKMTPQSTPSARSDADTAAGHAPWSGILTVEGVESGDGRMFATDALTWDELPLPLRWQKEGAHGGQNDVTVAVGNITRIWREPDPSGRANVNYVMGEGTIDLGNPDGREVYRRMRAGYMRGNSVDVDSIGQSDVELVYPTVGDPRGAGSLIQNVFAEPELTRYNSGRIRGTTLVEIPAFSEARLQLAGDAIGDSETLSLVAGAVRAHDTATVRRPWSASMMVKRLPSPLPLETARNVYAWIDETEATDGAVPKSACKFPHHEVSRDGTPGAANLTACSAGIAALHGARGGTTIPVNQRRAVYDHLAAHLRDGDQTPPAFETLEMEALVAEAAAALVAGAVIEIPDAPPREWFDEPTDVPQLGALTVTNEGRVYGYVAPTGVRHRSYAQKAQYVPMKKVDYGRFMGGETIVADGGRVTTGNITMNCGHATTAFNISGQQASEHYDNTCSIVATVRVGENKNGVWVAGALLPDVDRSQIQRMLACRLSGDWRAHLDRPGWREFVAALLVPVPGFAMERTAPTTHLVAGQLVASSVPVMLTNTLGASRSSMAVSRRAQRARGIVARARIKAIRAKISQS